MSETEQQGRIISFIVFILIAGLIVRATYNYFKDQKEDKDDDKFEEEDKDDDKFEDAELISEEQFKKIIADKFEGGMQIKLCQVSVILAYLACIYIISTIYYLIVTRSYGTPFKDALEKYPELKKIKMKSAHERGNAFYVGLAIGVISMVILKPFGDCF